jgi:hypothetical protein
MEAVDNMRMKASVPQVLTRETTLKNKDGSFAVEQVVLLHIEGKLAPLEATVLLRGGAAPYEVGEYGIAPDSFGAGQYGRIDFRLRLGARLAPAAVADKRAA